MKISICFPFRPVKCLVKIATCDNAFSVAASIFVNVIDSSLQTVHQFQCQLLLAILMLVCGSFVQT